MSNISKAKITLGVDSNGHTLLDELKIPYRIRGCTVYANLNGEQFDRYYDLVQERSKKFAETLDLIKKNGERRLKDETGD